MKHVFPPWLDSYFNQKICCSVTKRTKTGEVAFVADPNLMDDIGESSAGGLLCDERSESNDPRLAAQLNRQFSVRLSGICR